MELSFSLISQIPFPMYISPTHYFSFSPPGRYMYHPLLPVSNDKDDPAVYGDFAMLERSPAAKQVRDSMIRYSTC